MKASFSALLVAGLLLSFLSLAFFVPAEESGRRPEAGVAEPQALGREPEEDQAVLVADAALDSTRPTPNGPTPVTPHSAEAYPDQFLPDASVPDALPAEPDANAVDPGTSVEARWPLAARQSGGVIADRQVIAYYGHPRSRFMGALGETPIDQMAARLLERAAEYDAINGSIGVAPAFHIIFATVHPDATVGIVGEATLMEYINYAAENDILVFLDHQIGKGTVEGAIRSMLPYLRFPHVHLAFDPEWATTQPGQVIGSVDAADINLAQQMMDDYLAANGYEGKRMLVVHQFNYRMIGNRERVRTDFERVQLIHHADGFGSPAQKRATWEFNVLARNIPLKGFKLFYPKPWRSGGFDVPLMSPEEVVQLDPVPVYIQYQ